MYRKFIAVILVTAVAITGLTAAPARAQDSDLLKILGGVAAIAIIGTAIAKNKDRDDHVSRRHPYYTPKPRTKHHGHKHHVHKHHANCGHYQTKKHGRHQDKYARPLPPRVKRKVLPASCRVQARNRNGNFPGYTHWCLQRKFAHVNALPNRCATRARLSRNNKNSVVYSKSCLNRYGYTAAAY